MKRLGVRKRRGHDSRPKRSKTSGGTYELTPTLQGRVGERRFAEKRTPGWVVKPVILEESACTVLASLHRRSPQPSFSLQLRHPGDAVETLLRDFRGLDREVFGIVILSAQNHVQGVQVVSIGAVDQTVVHPREVFKEAILAGALKILAFHNHPSGDPAPSREDETLTQQLTWAGKMLGIPVVDHIILGQENYFSFAEKGLM